MSLATICDALAAISVTANGVTPTAYSYDELKNSYDKADLPARLIMPFGERAEGALNAITIAGNAQAVWTLTDLLLWDTIGQGRGLPDMYPALVAYIDAYTAAVKSHFRLIKTPAATIENVRFSPGSWTFGDKTYWGVECRLTIRELG